MIGLDWGTGCCWWSKKRVLSSERGRDWIVRWWKCEGGYIYWASLTKVDGWKRWLYIRSALSGFIPQRLIETERKVVKSGNAALGNCYRTDVWARLAPGMATLSRLC